MNSAECTSGLWRIAVRGTLSPTAAALLADIRVVVVDTETVVVTGPMPPDTCVSTVAELQSLGLDVVSLHWVPAQPGPPTHESSARG